jgi:hypothetical protein
MRSWIKLVLFFSSFSPLFMILLLQSIDFEYLMGMEHKGTYSSFSFEELLPTFYFSITMIILSVIPNVILWIVLWRSRCYTPITTMVKNFSTKNNDVINYIATYLIPFFSFKTDKFSDLLAFYLLLFVLSLVYLKANMFYINPILILLGFNVIEINGDCIVILKGDIQCDDLLELYRINNQVYYGVKI